MVNREKHLVGDYLELKPEGLREIYAALSETVPKKKQKVKIDLSEEGQLLAV